MKRFNVKRPYRKPRKSTKKYSKFVKVYNKPTLNPVIKTYVKKELAKNIENKITQNVANAANVLTITAFSEPTPPTFSYYRWAPQGNGNLFSISQGTAQNERVGNKIKIKRWIVKGSVYANSAFGQTEANGNPNLSGQMIVKLYFGRKVNISDVVDGTLAELYQEGGQAITPDGDVVERLYAINKDNYKVYWQRTFKIGVSVQAGTGAVIGESNNDYKLSREFGFDICKLVCKNHITKYDDNTADPNDAMLDSLTLWATCTNPTGDIITAPLFGGGGPGTAYNSVPYITATSYAEYEDA